MSLIDPNSLIQVVANAGVLGGVTFWFMKQMEKRDVVRDEFNQKWLESQLEMMRVTTEFTEAIKVNTLVLERVCDKLDGKP